MRQGQGLSAFVSRGGRSSACSAAAERERSGARNQGARLPWAAGRHGQRRRHRHRGARRRERLRRSTTSQNAADFTAANLEQYRAVVFLGNAGNALNAAQETALQGYINNGGGFVGIGGAAEGEPGSTFYGNLIGARPTATSPTATAEKVVEVGDRVHPATRTLPLEWTRSDVWYEWQTRPTGQVHTVARYRAPNAPAGDGTDIGGTDWPISWCRDFQGGRSFYTGMGRTAASYDEANFRTHLLGAIQWSAGMLRAGCKATIAANYSGERLVDGSSGDLTHTGESHGVAHRAQRLGLLHRPRRLPHATPSAAP